MSLLNPSMDPAFITDPRPHFPVQQPEQIHPFSREAPPSSLPEPNVSIPFLNISFLGNEAQLMNPLIDSHNTEPIRSSPVPDVEDETLDTESGILMYSPSVDRVREAERLYSTSMGMFGAQRPSELHEQSLLSEREPKPNLVVNEPPPPPSRPSVSNEKGKIAFKNKNSAPRLIPLGHDTRDNTLFWNSPGSSVQSKPVSGSDTTRPLSDTIFLKAPHETREVNPLSFKRASSSHSCKHEISSSMGLGSMNPKPLSDPKDEENSKVTNPEGSLTGSLQSPIYSAHETYSPSARPNTPTDMVSLSQEQQRRIETSSPITEPSMCYLEENTENPGSIQSHLVEESECFPDSNQEQSSGKE